MRKLIFILVMSVLPFMSGAQSGIGDYINMHFGLYGIERVQNMVKHTNTSGYFYIQAESLCVIDTIWWMPGKRPAGVSATMHTDTLFAGIAYPFQVKSIKLTKGRCLLYKNKP